MVSHVDDPAMRSAAFMLATTPVGGGRKTTTALPEIPEIPRNGPKDQERW